MKRQANFYHSIELMRVIGVMLITLTHVKHEFESGLAFLVLEEIPLYGTLLLSVISGFLFAANDSGQPILMKKIKSLLIPYLIANGIVIVLVSVCHYFGVDFLNRLKHDMSLITEGLFSLTIAPVNPPTYFLRDLFMIFCCIALLKREWWSLVFIVPYVFWGTLFLRWDILILFTSGYLLQKFLKNKERIWPILAGLPLIAILIYFYPDKWHRHIVAIGLFAALVNIPMKFVRTGGFTYLLHLYHSPIMLVAFAVAIRFIENQILLVVLQIATAYLVCFLAFKMIRRLKWNFIIGNR